MKRNMSALSLVVLLLALMPFVSCGSHAQNKHDSFPFTSRSYGVDVLFSLASPSFSPPLTPTSGHFDVSQELQRTRFTYPIGKGSRGHTDIVDWSGPVAMDYFWQFTHEGGIQNCSCGPFGSGSNRTPFYRLDPLEDSFPIGEQFHRLAQCDCWFNGARNTTQCYAVDGGYLPWWSHSSYNGENQWDWAEPLFDPVFESGLFDLPSCFQDLQCSSSQSAPIVDII